MRTGLRSDSMQSPWGAIDSTTKTGVSGVTMVDTASHGGYRVTVKRGKEMHPALLDLAIRYGRHYWFEEDCNYVAVLLTWPKIANTYWPTTQWKMIRAVLVKSLRRWNPKAFKQYFKHVA